jgi:hypothetical protein
MAMTADGKIATANRARFTSFGSKRDLEHLYELRATADAVMCGARTVKFRTFWERAGRNSGGGGSNADWLNTICASSSAAAARSIRRAAIFKNIFRRSSFDHRPDFKSKPPQAEGGCGRSENLRQTRNQFSAALALAAGEMGRENDCFAKAAAS